MPTHMAIPPMTDARLLTLMQWLSPAFPLGSFSYSHGIEAAVAAGLIHDADSLTGWLTDVLRHGTGRSDAIWLRLAAETDDLTALNAQCRAFMPARERLAEADRQGAAFCNLARQVWGIDMADVTLAPAVGHAARQIGMDIDTVVPLFLSSFAGNLVAGAQRLLPLGQTRAQAINAALHPVCIAVASDTRGATIDDIHSTALMSDIMAMTHETQTVRLFQS
ncbi:urease accessory protein UreF [Loktanella sp. DSM 29012]|uniref:urease accessory protein UreF n=1 Tax=Loktanella sp. DSM 29012 TaxID=1881056 RepID=UPI00210CC45D|nr:urease accessory UreF family protein [Loktanella sp. DSM 29012]